MLYGASLSISLAAAILSPLSLKQYKVVNLLAYMSISSFDIHDIAHNISCLYVLCPTFCNSNTFKNVYLVFCPLYLCIIMCLIWSVALHVLSLYLWIGR